MTDHEDRPPTTGTGRPHAATLDHAALAHARWRVGRSVGGRTLYTQVGPEASKRDILIGHMDTEELGALVVDEHNAHLDALDRQPSKPAGALEPAGEVTSEAEEARGSAGNLALLRRALAPWRCGAAHDADTGCGCRDELSGTLAHAAALVAEADAQPAPGGSQSGS